MVHQRDELTFREAQGNIRILADTAIIAEMNNVDARVSLGKLVERGLAG
jgi:hypothetical protein